MSQQTITLLFLVFTIISFILEKIPLGLTASICAIGLTLTGVVDVSTTFSQYVNSNVILCVGMFVVARHYLKQEWQIKSEVWLPDLPEQKEH